MTDARRRFWHRAGPLAAFAGLAVASAGQGCGGGGETTMGTGGTGGTGGSSTTTTSTTTSTTTTSTTTTTTTTTGTGGMGGGGGMGGTGGVTGDVKPGADAHSALDATPDLDGTTIYFTAIDPIEGPGVFKAPADGSNLTPVKVAAGNPFVAPFGIAIGTDGNQLYVADPGADAGNDRGEIFVLPVGGGTPAALSGSADTVPRSLEIIKEGTIDVIYFTGNDKADGQPGVFKIPVTGGTVTAVAKGAPFVDPSGIAVAADGTTYVADTISSLSHTANIIKVDKNGTATTFLTDLKVGYPCGVALSQDEQTLLISALDKDKATDVLLQIDIGNGMSKDPVTMGIDTFYESAGLHRAKGKNVFAWADSSAGPQGGRVFVVK